MRRINPERKFAKKFRRLKTKIREESVLLKSDPEIYFPRDSDSAAHAHVSKITAQKSKSNNLPRMCAWKPFWEPL